MENEKQEKFTLQQWRGLRNISKTDLAKRSNLTPNTITSYENSIDSLRNARYKNLESLATALGIKVDDIFLSPGSEKPKLAARI